MNYIKISFLYICISILFISCVKKFQEPLDNPDIASFGSLYNAKVIIEFEDKADSVNIETAALRYNKDFAVSIHLDDGSEDIYTHAYPLLQGGEAMGESFPGMAFTDGCGNPVYYKMSTALFSMSIDEESDLHDPDQVNTFIKWPQLAHLYKKGWGVYNHGFSADSDVVPEASITANHEYVKMKTEEFISGGIEMRVFINPNGDTLFTEPAFEQGYRMALREGYQFGRPYLDVSKSWNKDQLRMGRTNLFGDVNLSELVEEVAEHSTGGKPLWASYYSHSVSNGEWGYDFATFRDHMNQISGKYGVSGMDNMWMTTEEEMLDYFVIRDGLQIEKQTNGNVLEISFGGEIPDDLRFYPVTLLLESDKQITSIKIEGLSKSSFNGIGLKQSMINLEGSKP